MERGFTEQGAIMAANVLNSPRVVQMSVFVVHAFLKMRELLGGTKELARRLKALEAKLTARLDGHEAAPWMCSSASFACSTRRRNRNRPAGKSASTPGQTTGPTGATKGRKR